MATCGTGAVTVKAIDVDPLRAWASVIETGSDLAPLVVLALTVALNEKVPLPLSAKLWAAAPPIVVRSAVTVIPVLVGFVPGVTVTVSNVGSPADTEAGFAEPEALGDVGTALLHGCGAELVFLGVPAAAVKSAELLSVSVQPLALRTAIVVLDSVGAAVPSKKFAPS